MNVIQKRIAEAHGRLAECSLSIRTHEFAKLFEQAAARAGQKRKEIQTVESPFEQTNARSRTLRNSPGEFGSVQPRAPQSVNKPKKFKLTEKCTLDRQHLTLSM